MGWTMRRQRRCGIQKGPVDIRSGNIGMKCIRSSAPISLILKQNGIQLQLILVDTGTHSDVF